MSEQVPNGWKLKTISEFAKVARGYAFKSSDFVKSGFPIIRITNISNLNTLDLSTNIKYLSPNRENEFKDYLIQENDFLLVMVGATIGNYANATVKKKKLFLNQNMWCLRIKDNYSNTQKFAIFGLQKVVQDFLRTQQGSAREFFTQKEFGKSLILIPPLLEQKKIASILSSVDDMIEKIQLQINKHQDLKKGTINELLTKGIGHTEFKDSDLGRIPKNWQILKVSKLLEFKNGLNKEKSAFGKGNPIVNYMDVFLNPVIYSNKITGKVSLKDTEIERFKVNTGDIFFTRTSETVEEIGMSSVIIKTADKTTFSGFILRGRPITKFLYPSLSGYFFRTNYVREQIKKTCSFTTRALTNGSLLGEVVVMLPTLDEQKLIFKILDDINNLILKKNSLIKKHVLLKKSLMQDLLTGKVRVSVN